MNGQLRETGGKVRLFVDSTLAPGAGVELNDGQTHYLLYVMRARAGQRALVFNGRDGEWLAEIVNVAKRSCRLECRQQTREQFDTPDIWLCFAPIKRTPADYLTQKATELGVRALQPVLTHRTVVTRVNTDRMRANAVEAAEQSDRLAVPEVREPVTLRSLLSVWPGERSLLFCDEAGEAPAIAQQLAHAGSERWAVLTGPEGGFTPAERDHIRRCRSVIPVSLGPRILRADTAALAALSIFQALRGDWR